MTFAEAEAAPRVPARTWTIIVLLGLSGQIAWNVENTWFATFVYDTITPDSRPIAAMTAVSAAVATATTLGVGAWSDRLGRRKPFILIGYVLWALSTAIFPAAAIPQSIGIAVFLVILLDSVMTFFGSTGYDAAFNAWVTDVTQQGNRGVVEGIIQALPVITTMIGMGVSGFVIDSFGYTPFFLALGGIVLAMGLVGSVLLEDAPDLRPARVESVWADLRRLLSAASIRANSALFIVFAALCTFSIGWQITWPYEVIYLNNTVGISKTDAGIITAMIAPVLLLLAIPIGRLTDAGRGFPVAIAGYIISAIGFVGFALSHSLVWLAIFGALKSVGFLMNIVLVAWHRNLLPDDARGAYQGVRLVFMVLIPMVVGATIGSALIQTFGESAIIDGRAGVTPPSLIYWAAALVTLSTLIPVMMLRRRSQIH